MLEPNSDEIQKSNSKIPSIAILLIVICWLLALTNQAYFQGVFEVSEAREGVVVNEIKEYGTWILPLRNGEIVPSKPPLFHWATAALSAGSKNLNELYLRGVSLLTAIFSLLAFYLFLKLDLKSKVPDSKIPLFSTIIYATTYGFIQMSIDGRVDMTFNLFFLMSVLVLNYYLLNDKIPNFKHKILLSIIIGLGILSRGPLSPVLFYLALGSGLLLFKRIRDLKKWLVDDYFLLVLGPILISAPWYLASKFLGKPELISRQIVFENISRFFGSEKIPSKPFWFYLEHIWMQSFPWGFVLLVVFALILKSKKSFYTNEHLRRYIHLYGAQALAIFIFFSISSGKRKAYLLSILPFLALLTGVLYYRLTEIYRVQTFKTDKIEKFSLLFVALTLIAILLRSILYIGVPNFLDFSFFQGLNHLPLISLIVPLLVTLCLFYVISRSKENNYRIGIIISCIALQSYISLPAFFYLTKGESHSYKYFVKEVQSIVQSNEELKVIKSNDDESLDSFLFYYGKRVPMVSPNNEIGQGTYLTKKSWFDSQPAEFQDNVEVIYEGKRLADKDRRNLLIFRIADNL